MNNSTTKEQIGCDVICRSHSARTERDLYRICPSKLSKRELEDLYFALLENSLELKKTINVQQDKIKLLSTRVQRITGTHRNGGREKDCCGSKAVVNEQKEAITDLTKKNERMGERIRVLNMRLCSAKQFLKRTPSQAAKACARCSFKNSSLSALNAKQSDSNEKTTAVSCQFLDKDVSAKTTETVGTATEIPEKEEPERLCNENKCRTMMEEFKEKIVNLKEELSRTHDEYSSRITKLESQMCSLQEENVRVRSDRASSEHALLQRGRRADELADSLRGADAKCNELNMELTIEKRKVAELETGLKLANMADPVARTLEQLTAFNEENNSPSVVRNTSVCSHCSQKTLDSSPSSNTQLHPPSSSPKTKSDVKYPKSDDSGFADLNKSCEADEDSAVLKLNQELLRKIAELQTQLDVLRISTAVETAVTQDKLKELEFDGVEMKDVDETQPAEKSSNAMILSRVENQNSEKQRNVIERDTDIESPGVNETEASSSKPWEDYLITGSLDKEYVKSGNNVVSESSTTVREADKINLSRDNDNRYQIPGPLPVVFPSQDKPNKRKNYRNSLKQNSRDSIGERLKNKKVNSEEKTVKIFENSKDSYFYSDKQDEFDRESKMKNLALISNLKEYAKDLADIGHKNDVVEKKGTTKSVSITDVEAKLADRTPTRDSIMVNRKKLPSRSVSDEMGESGIEAAGPKDSTTSFFIKCASAVQEVSDGNRRAAERATQVEPKADYELCESRAVICRCPVLAKRDVAVFRSCSGTLRFRTTALGDKLRRCGCQVQTDCSGTQMDPPSARRDSATYTAPAPAAAERATSPDNTEHEISSLTDLPSERDGKSPRAVLSPGEEKATMTYTYTDTDTIRTDYGSLSEGELPTGRVRRLSTGERLPRDPIRPSLVSSQKMEATLQSISEELARCRQLLLGQRPQEPAAPQQRRASTVAAVHALRPSVANRRIADARAPTCVFTLHIGTLVLSDEAMLYSRDKPLVLTWQFYSQNAAMTRVQTGRVVIFDFATEYDVTFDDEFLDYMKHEDMSITLCEISKQEEPLAVCLLPLREALLHTNRRADMSLALVPMLPPGGTRDSVGDEIGVLDLWCSLRVEISLLSVIHRAMHTPSPPTWHNSNPLRSESRVTTFDPSEGRSSRDFDLDLTDKQPRTAARQPLTEDMGGHRRYSEDVPANTQEPSCRYDDEVQQYRASSRPYRRRSSQTQKSVPSSDLGHKGQVGFEANWPTLHHESSGIITNEVPAHIRSTEDLKHALEKNVHHRSIGQLPMLDESREHADSIQDLLKKDKDYYLGGLACQQAASTEGYVRDGSDGTLNKRNQNISIGLKKLVEAAKKTVKYTDSTTQHFTTEEPQKENSADSDEGGTQSIVITILWLALNEECEAIANPNVQRLYVAYSFLGRRGADLETPYSLPKPRHYADKCYFNFKKTFHLHECDLPLLGHMSRCRAGGGASTDPRDCLVFTLVSEPPEDPLGLTSCEDIGYAYLYLGDVLAYSGGSGGYTEVIGVRGVRGGVCGVLAVRVDNLPVLRRALTLSHSQRDLARASASSAAPLPAPSSTIPFYRVRRPLYTACSHLPP